MKYSGVLRHYSVLIVLVAFLALMGLYYCFLHRKPFTQNAFVIANTRPVSPLVEGYLTGVSVKNHQRVRKGDKLFSVFKPPYELKVRRLEAAIHSAEAKLAVIEAEIRAAEATVEAKNAENANRAYLSRQAAQMYAGAAVSQTYAEETRRAELAARAELLAARHKLDSLRHAARGAAADIVQLQKELELARIYLEQTDVYALEDAVVNNMFLSPGGYYKPGDTLFALVDDSIWWVQANFEETDLSMIQPGQKATVWLWQYPGKKFNGVVESINWSTERRKTSGETGVQMVEKENQWFLLPQRFPVQIRITDPPDERYPLHLGGSAFVSIDTSAQLFKQLIWRVFRWD